MEDELKPCPFCGGYVGIARLGDDDDGFWVITRSRIEDDGRCKCRIFMESEKFDPGCQNDSRKAKEQLIERWNTRV